MKTLRAVAALRVLRAAKRKTPPEEISTLAPAVATNVPEKILDPDEEPKMIMAPNDRPKKIIEPDDGGSKSDGPEKKRKHSKGGRRSRPSRHSWVDSPNFKQEQAAMQRNRLYWLLLNASSVGAEALETEAVWAMDGGTGGYYLANMLDGTGIVEGDNPVQDGYCRVLFHSRPGEYIDIPKEDIVIPKEAIDKIEDYDTGKGRGEQPSSGNAIPKEDIVIPKEENYGTDKRKGEQPSAGDALSGSKEESPASVSKEETPALKNGEEKDQLYRFFVPNPTKDIKPDAKKVRHSQLAFKNQFCHTNWVRISYEGRYEGTEAYRLKNNIGQEISVARESFNEDWMNVDLDFLASVTKEKDKWFHLPPTCRPTEDLEDVMSVLKTPSTDYPYPTQFCQGREEANCAIKALANVLYYWLEDHTELLLEDPTLADLPRQIAGLEMSGDQMKHFVSEFLDMVTEVLNRYGYKLRSSRKKSKDTHFHPLNGEGECNDDEDWNSPVIGMPLVYNPLGSSNRPPTEVPHCVGFYGKYVFESTFPAAVPCCKEALDVICWPWSTGTYAGLRLSYRVVKKKKAPPKKQTTPPTGDDSNSTGSATMNKPMTKSAKKRKRQKLARALAQSEAPRGDANAPAAKRPLTMMVSDNQAL